MKITFLILAHNDPDSIIESAEYIVAKGHNVIIHYDATGKGSDFNRIKDSLDKLEGNALAISEISCSWGKWSLVEAPLTCLRKIDELSWECDYVHLMSGTEQFIKPVEELAQFLNENPNTDHIESVDITSRPWVQGGLEIERFKFYFPYSFIEQPRRFNFLTYLQRIFGIQRSLPATLSPRMGSQWWTLRHSTCAKLLDFIDNNQEVVKYFRSTWIPDESFFQTIVAHLVPEAELSQTQLVFHWLNPLGRPFVFKNGHEDLIKSLPHFLVRKVSPLSSELMENIRKLRSNPSMSERPTIDLIRNTTERLRNRLASECNFAHQATWAASSPNWKHLQKLILIIFHQKEDSEDLINIIRAENETFQYMGQPFSSDYRQRPPEFRMMQPNDQFVERRLLSLCSHQNTRVPVILVQLENNSPPRNLPKISAPRCAYICYTPDSRLEAQVSVNNVCRETNISSIPLNRKEFINELQKLSAPK